MHSNVSCGCLVSNPSWAQFQPVDSYADIWHVGFGGSDGGCGSEGRDRLFSCLCSRLCLCLCLCSCLCLNLCPRSRLCPRSLGQRYEARQRIVRSLHVLCLRERFSSPGFRERIQIVEVIV